MTRIELKRRIAAYQKAYKLPSFTQAVEGVAGELPATPGTVWRYLSGARKIPPMAVERIKAITPARTYE